MHVYRDDAQLQHMLLVNRRWRASPFFHMSDARRKSLLRLTAEVLRLRLSQANLVSTGNKQALVERLLEYEDSISRGDGDPSSSADSETDDSEVYSSGPVSVPLDIDGGSRNPDDPGPSGLSTWGHDSRAGRCRHHEAASQPGTAVSGDESQSAASDAAASEDGGDPEGPPTCRRRRRASASSIEVAVPRVAEEGTGPPPTCRRRRRALASSIEAAVSRAAEEGTGDPPTRSSRRRATASSTEAAVSRAAEKRIRAPPTRHNPKAHCSNRLEHRSERGSPRTMADKDAVTSTHRRKTAFHEVVEQLGPRKASPFVARCRPSRSRSYSPRSHRRRRHSSHSDDSSDSRSSRSSRSSSSSRYRSRRRSRQHHRRRSSSLEEFSESPFSSCVTAPARHLVRRIRKGKFVKFDRLLPSVLDEVFTVQQGKRTGDKGLSKRHIRDFANWVEAWNIFLAIRVQAFPHTALQMIKYQAIMCQLFSSYPVGVCIKYDSLFRQAVARDKARLIPWDQVKEDILVWCATCHPFRSKPNPISAGTTPSSRPNTASGSTTTQSGRHVTHSITGQEICRRFNYSTCSRVSCAFAHKCWIAGCGGDHSGKTCPRAVGVPG